MRTAQICPTCAVYTNAKCVIYDGPFLTNSGISPMDDLEYALGLIDGQLGVLASSISNSGITLTTIGTSGPATLTGNALNIPNYIYTGWGLTGNSGTVPGTNFIGTTDNKDVVFKANNIEYLKLVASDQLLLLSKNLTSNSTGASEVAVRSLSGNGYVAINQNSTDKGNILISNGDGITKILTLASGGLKNILIPNASGTLALTTDITPATLQNVTAGANKNLTNGINLQGNDAGYNQTGTSNINAFGSAAGQSNSASYVNFMGYQAGKGNSGEVVNAFGSSAAFNNSGTSVNAFGLIAAKGNSGSDVNAFGSAAGQNNTGSNVNMFGNSAGVGNGISGATIFINTTLPSYVNHTAAAAAITTGAGGIIGNTYLYHNQATNSIGAVRL